MPQGARHGDGLSRLPAERGPRSFSLCPDTEAGGTQHMPDSDVAQKVQKEHSAMKRHTVISGQRMGIRTRSLQGG